MKKLFKLLCPVVSVLSLATIANASTVTLVECYSGGNDPRITFSNPIIITEQSDISGGGLLIKGRKVVVEKTFDQARISKCRDWMIDSGQGDNGFGSYWYSKVKRDWNIKVVKLQGASTLLTCAIGSSLTEYDSVSAYIEEMSKNHIGSTRNGSSDSQRDYESGANTVSSGECIDNLLP